MKQILIKKNPDIKEIAGSNVNICNKNEKVVIDGIALIYIRIPLKIEVLNGGKFELNIRLHKNLIQKGVFLIGAYYENDEVTALFTTFDGHKVIIEPNEPILIGTLIEPIVYRQIDDEVVGGFTVVKSQDSTLKLEEKPKNKRKTKKPKN
jgi:hypothetical protein